jgi:hypothetical protein
MNEIINKYYENNNFPSLDKLYKLVKGSDESAKYNIKKSDIKAFLGTQREYELLKPKFKKKKKKGHITAFSFKENAQMDIYDLSKYNKSNNNYKYILCLVDVFSRKAFARKMKTKSDIDVTTNLKDILKDYTPHTITSDTDASFMSAECQKVLNKYDIYHDTVIAGNDHSVLGIIDRFALTIKTIFSKLFLRTDKTNWINHMDTIIKQYNDLPHSSLDGLTPNEATNENYQHDIAMINNAKVDDKPIQSDFKAGDKVRLRIKKMFRKGTEPKYTDEVYEVKSASGLRVTLTNGKTYHEADIMLTNFDSTPDKNIIEQTTKVNSKERKLKRDGIEESNLASREKRTIKPNRKYI